MKRFSFFLALALLVAFGGIANAGIITLEATTGTWDDAGTTKIIPGLEVTFDIRVNNDGVTANGITNGFVVYGSSAPYTVLTGAVIDPTYEARFDLVWAINSFADGNGPDTVGFGGSKLSGEGLTAGYNDVPYRLTTGGFTEFDVICLDSSFYPPTGAWLWAPGGAPSWDGPHCFTVETPDCLPPIFDGAPLTLSGSHCDVMQYDFDAHLDPVDITPNPVLSFSADIGTIDPVTGVWTYAPTLADVGASIAVTISASNSLCESDIVVNLTFTNDAPVLDCSAAGGDISTGSTNDFTVTATDDCDGISFSVTGVLNATATIADPNVGDVVVVPVAPGPYTVTIEATDGNASSACTFGGNVIAGSLYQVEIPCIGAPEGPVFQGQHVELPININNKIIDGYDLLIGYDNSALSFQMATPGADLVADNWEYFTYRYGANGNCGNACPSGLLRLTAIAETNNGPNHPTLDGVNSLAVLDFLVTNDRTFECQSIPIRFYWMDCGDNALSTDGGNQLHVSEIVYDGDPILFPPNGSEIQDFYYGFPTYFGTQEECIVIIEDKPAPIRDVSFNNGCVFIACADAIDARGDLNLNYVANEIADAVLYSNYFVYGIGVFTINTEGQIAASDVNNDGLSLSVADLVYLIRVIVGDALPYPKLAPVNSVVADDNGKLSVDGDMGAALVVYEGNVNVELIADNMEIKAEFDGVNTRVLIYSLEGNTFNGEFVNANANVVSVELGSAEGAQVNAKVIPANFELAQNYPNPFNPTTTLGFAIPVASNVTLNIYNVTGQKVAEFSGAYEAGFQTIEWDASNMASGVYFYKLSAGNFTDTKKMVLLK